MNKGLKERCSDLFKLGHSYNKIASELSCSKGTVSYHLSKYKQDQIDTYKYEKNKLLDSILKEPIKSRDEFLLNYGDKLTAREKSYIIRNKFPSIIGDGIFDKYYYQKKRRLYKQSLVDYKGGKCCICGYNKCLSSLQFHHLDPTKKDFTISSKSSTSIEKIKLELDKCILVCANCHGEIHSNQVTYPILGSGLVCKTN